MQREKTKTNKQTLDDGTKPSQVSFRGKLPTKNRLSVPRHAARLCSGRQPQIFPPQSLKSTLHGLRALSGRTALETKIAFHLHRHCTAMPTDTPSEISHPRNRPKDIISTSTSSCRLNAGFVRCSFGFDLLTRFLVPSDSFKDFAWLKQKGLKAIRV